MPVGTVKGTAGLYEPAALTCSENASGVPHGTLASTVAPNGVVLVPSWPKLRSGYGEDPWVTVTPVVELVSSPLAPVSGSPELLIVSPRLIVLPGAISPPPGTDASVRTWPTAGDAWAAPGAAAQTASATTTPAACESRRERRNVAPRRAMVAVSTGRPYVPKRARRATGFPSRASGGGIGGFVPAQHPSRGLGVVLGVEAPRPLAPGAGDRLLLAAQRRDHRPGAPAGGALDLSVWSSGRVVGGHKRARVPPCDPSPEPSHSRPPVCDPGLDERARPRGRRRSSRPSHARAHALGGGARGDHRGRRRGGARGGGGRGAPPRGSPRARAGARRPRPAPRP